MSGADTSIRLARGGLYLSRALCERHFAGLESVVLLRRGDDLVILPVRHAAAGGYLLKLRNVAGDRVVHAPDFFRHHGVGDEDERDHPVTWDEDQAALLAGDLFSAY